MTDSNQTIDYIYKIVVLGDSNAGKTTFVHYLNNDTPRPIGSTIGVDFNTYTKKIDNIIIKSQIWDTAGQEQFKAITKSYFRNVTGALIFFDASQNDPILNVKQWIKDLNDNGVNDNCIICIANKCDLLYDTSSIPININGNIKILQCESTSTKKVQDTFGLFLNHLYFVQNNKKEDIKVYNSYKIHISQQTSQFGKKSLCCFS